MKEQKTILEASSEEAKEFFFRNDCYFSSKLPSYIDFSKLLKEISEKTKGKEFSSFCNQEKLREKNANYTTFISKGGRYGWRPVELINPLIYVKLVHLITEEENWKKIQNKFFEFSSNSKTGCASIPIYFEEPKVRKKSFQGENINQWLEKVEKRSIELSLDYNYVHFADIENFYPSIYTHSIAWALETKETAKKNKKSKELLGNQIDCMLQDMSCGQTNGIPQNSAVMDFISEMVLGYADMNLEAEINPKIDTEIDYKIIRYRDDYRIFTNTIKDGEIVIKKLINVLKDLGLYLNEKKTRRINDIVSEQIKSDKMHWQLYKGLKLTDLKISLLMIDDFLKKYPKSKQAFKPLEEIFKRLNKEKLTLRDKNVLTGIIVNMSLKHPHICSHAVLLIDSIIQGMDDKYKEKIIEKIRNKFQNLPDIEEFNLWIQRISPDWKKNNKKENSIRSKVLDKNVSIWTSEWIKDESIKKIIESGSIVDKEEFKRIKGNPMKKEELQIFYNPSYY